MTSALSLPLGAGGKCPLLHLLPVDQGSTGQNAGVGAQIQGVSLNTGVPHNISMSWRWGQAWRLGAGNLKMVAAFIFLLSLCTPHTESQHHSPCQQPSHSPGALRVCHPKAEPRGPSLLAAAEDAASPGQVGRKGQALGGGFCARPSPSPDVLSMARVYLWGWSSVPEVSVG